MIYLQTLSEFSNFVSQMRLKMRKHNTDKNNFGKIMKYSYQTSGTCCRQIDLNIEDGVIIDVAFIGGCHGNTQGVAALLKGMNAADAISRLEGIKCKEKATSCPDQLAKALKMIKSEC